MFKGKFLTFEIQQERDFLHNEESYVSYALVLKEVNSWCGYTGSVYIYIDVASAS